MATFNTELLTHNYAIAYFYAAWSGPCKIASQRIHQKLMAANETVGFGIIDVDCATDVVASQNVRDVPTVILYHGQSEVNRIIGLSDYNALDSFILDANTLPY